MDARERSRVALVSAEVRPMRWALAYSRALGWPLVPLWWPTPEGCACPQGASCPSPGKHPVIATGRNGASAAEGDLRRWWSRYPAANVGLATGWESGVAVLDLDSGEALAELVTRHGELPVTARARSGRDGTGVHYYFRHPPPPTDPAAERVVVPSRTLIAGADTRGVGGLIVLPPSLHVSGRRYEWQASPRQVPLAPAPGWMTEHRGPTPAPADLGDIAEGMTPYGRASLRAIMDELARTPEGQRNDTLNRCAYRLGRLRAHISPDAAAAALLSAAAGIGLSRAEAEGTLRSGYLAGVRAEKAGPEVAA